MLDQAELAVPPGERIALVGRNGSGKSTLMAIASGALPAEGERFVQPGTRIGWLAQAPDFGGHRRVLDYAAEMAAPHRAQAVLQRLGLSGEEDPATLSGGGQRRAALARALAGDPDLLLLDEPTNHLDLAAIEWLEADLLARRAAIVLISHDRRLLTRVARAVVWLDRGRTRRMEGGFDGFETWRDALLETEEVEAHRLERRIAREEGWMQTGVTARRKRNVRRVSELETLRAQRRARVAVPGRAALTAEAAASSGRRVIEAEGVGHARGGRVLVRDLSLIVTRGDRLGIVGPNGAGKTTLLRLLTGEETPEAGRVRRGTGLEIAWLDQQRSTIDPATTLADALTRGGGEWVQLAGERRHVMGVLKDWLFRPEQARTPIGRLSGGERGRLMLALALTGRANLLVLDEPTNDLDLETLDLLQERLAETEATVLLVSHDRDFLDRTVTSVLAAEGDGRWVEYAGGYSDMLAQRGGAAEPEAPRRRSVAVSAARGTVPREAPARAAGLSFTDRHELARLGPEIARLEAEIAQAAARIGSGSVDAAALGRETAALAAMQARLEAAEERWLELELRQGTAR